MKTRTGNAIGPYEDLPTSVKRHKLQWSGHLTRPPGLAKSILQGTIHGERRRGRQRRRWEDNNKEWTGLEWSIILRKAENREEWRRLVVGSALLPQRSAGLREGSRTHCLTGKEVWGTREGLGLFKDLTGYRQSGLRFILRPNWIQAVGA